MVMAVMAMPLPVVLVALVTLMGHSSNCVAVVGSPTGCPRGSGTKVLSSARPD